VSLDHKEAQDRQDQEVNQGQPVQVDHQDNLDHRGLPDRVEDQDPPDRLARVDQEGHQVLQVSQDP